MQSRLRVQGHPIQPMLITFPLGLFVSATLFDLADVAGGPVFLGTVGYWTAVAGLFAAALTVAAGMVDLWDAPSGRTRRTAMTFNLVNLGVAVLFVLACLVRIGSTEHSPSGGLVFLELLALGGGLVGVRLGGRLVRQFDRGRPEEKGLDAIDAVSSARGA